MTRPRELKKITLPMIELNAMPSERRSALLMLGLFLNEANWLRKLLVGAVLGTSDTPEGRASFALTSLMATTLVGKIFEGWDHHSHSKIFIGIQKNWNKWSRYYQRIFA